MFVSFLVLNFDKDWLEGSLMNLTSIDAIIWRENESIDNHCPLWLKIIMLYASHRGERAGYLHITIYI
jgi:hypothetical protein